MTLTEDFDELLRGPSMSTANETSYQTAHPSREALAKSAEKMALCTEEIECVDLCNVGEHKAELIDNEVFHS